MPDIRRESKPAAHRTVSLDENKQESHARIGLNELRILERSSVPGTYQGRVHMLEGLNSCRKVQDREADLWRARDYLSTSARESMSASVFNLHPMKVCASSARACFILPISFFLSQASTFRRALSS